jgi:hypothetical protein
MTHQQVNIHKIIPLKSIPKEMITMGKVSICSNRGNESLSLGYGQDQKKLRSDQRWLMLLFFSEALGKN